MSIRVLIADDQSLIRGALSALLNTEPDIEVVASTGDGSAVVDLVREHRVDVALLDIEMPGTSGIEAAQLLREAGLGVRCAMVTTFGRPGYLKKALAAGALGFLVKDTPPEQLAESVRRIYAGHRVVDPLLAEQGLFAPESPLSEREVEVCHAVLTGANTRAIAESLFISEGTARNHISAIIAKTRAGNRFEAARVARDNGWL